MKKILLLIGLFFFTTAVFKTTAQAAGAESVYDRVMRTGTIKVGYAIYPPGVLKDANTGKLSGIVVDALNKAAENLQLKTEYAEEVPWGSMIEGLMSDRYDVIVYVWSNSTRARMADFSIPLYYSPINAYARPDNKRFAQGFAAGMKDPATTIAAMDGEMCAIIAKTDYPNLKVIGVPENSSVADLFLNVATEKADVYFGEPAAEHDFSKTNPNKVKNLTPDKPIRIFGNTIMFKRGQMEFKNMLDRALEELLNSGYIDQLIKKYEPFPGALYPVALPYRMQ